MTELGRPPIEPMSDVEWARVERGLWNRLEREEPAARPVQRAQRWLWLAVPAAAVVAVVVAIALVTGERAPTTVTPAAPSSDLARVTTGAAPSSATFGDVYIELDATTALRADGDRAELEHGGASFTVAPRGVRNHFVVEAGDARVRVVGTQFRVTRDGDRVAASVERGSVEITFRGRIVQVIAGQSWHSDAPAIVRQTIPLAPPPPPPVRVTPPPTQITPPPPLPRPPPAKPMPTRPTPVPAPRPVPIDDAAEFRRMSALEPTAPDAAITGYLAIAARSPIWAEPARFAAGRVAFDHHDRRAELLLDDYLAHHPHGQNAIDARRMIDRLHRRP